VGRRGRGRPGPLHRTAATGEGQGRDQDRGRPEDARRAGPAQHQRRAAGAVGDPRAVPALLDRRRGPHRVGPGTVANYRSLIDRHLIPGLGRHRLRDLTPEHVDRFLRAKADTGLSRSSVGRLRSILTDALTHAERRQLVVRNAGRLSILPATTATPVGQRALTAAERDRFISTALAFHPPSEGGDATDKMPHRLAALMAVMVHIGLRPGEGTGLRWDDLDTTARTLTVSGSIKRLPKASGRGYDLVRGPVKKSSAGERTIRLSPTLIGLLDDHRARQAAERDRAGAYRVEMGLMFPSEIGTPLDPSNLRRQSALVATAAGIDGPVNPYTARHTAASLFIDAGASLDQVADLLGDDLRTVVLHYRHRVRPVVELAGGGLEPSCRIREQSQRATRHRTRSSGPRCRSSEEDGSIPVDMH